MPLEDWNLEANEEANMDPNNLNPTNSALVNHIINSLFVDYGDDEKHCHDAFETNDYLVVYEWHKIDRRN